MKKYFEILIALLVAIGIAIVPANAHAMKQGDLGGHAYFTNNPDENDGRTIIVVFNKNASRVYTTVLHKEADNTYKPMIKSEHFDKAMESKKGFNKYSYKTHEEGDFGYLLNKKGNKIYLPNDGWCKISGDPDNGFHVVSKDKTSYNEQWIPAPINVNFSW